MPSSFASSLFLLLFLDDCSIDKKIVHNGVCTLSNIAIDFFRYCCTNCFEMQLLADTVRPFFKGLFQDLLQINAPLNLSNNRGCNNLDSTVSRIGWNHFGFSMLFEARYLTFKNTLKSCVVLFALLRKRTPVYFDCLENCLPFFQSFHFRHSGLNKGMLRNTNKSESFGKQVYLFY